VDCIGCPKKHFSGPSRESAARPGAERACRKAGDRRGGFPTPALKLTTASERRIWFDGYVRTYLERDLQDLASISGLPDFRRLMRALTGRS